MENIMSLNNVQYNKIRREYDQRQQTSKHLLDEKYQHLYKLIPSLQTIDEKIASLSAHYAKQAVLGDPDASSNLKKESQKLYKQKQELLLQHGFSDDYLQPNYVCPLCKDTGYINTKKCQCFKQAIVDLLYSQSNLKSILSKENFSNFSLNYYDDTEKEKITGLTPKENMKRVLQHCQNFIQNFDQQYSNILLYGNTGVGKTFLANCIAKELLESAHTVIYLTSFQLFDILEKNKFLKNEDPYDIKDQFNGILQCDLLIIDDLGTELNNSFISSQLYLCINERHLSQKSTIISTNLSLDDLNYQYSERIFSRITSNYTLLKIFGDDIRIKKAFSS